MSLFEICIAFGILAIVITFATLSTQRSQVTIEQSSRQIMRALTRIERTSIIGGQKIWLTYDPSCHCIQKHLETAQSKPLLALHKHLQLTLNSAYKYNQLPALLYSAKNFSSPASIVLNSSSQGTCVIKQSILGARHNSCS